MAKLVHEHRLLREGVSTHLDSKGVKFGADEHSKALENYSWTGDIQVSDSVSHTHVNITESVVDPDRHVVWIYDPPNANESEREIGRRSARVM